MVELNIEKNYFNNFLSIFEFLPVPLILNTMIKAEFEIKNH